MSADGALLVSARPRLTIDGKASPKLARDLIRLETAEDEAGLARLEAVFLNWDSSSEGKAVDFVHFDRAEADFGKSVEVAFDMGGGMQTVFSGLVTGIGADYPELRPPELTLLAEDALARLRMRRRTRVFEDDSDRNIINTVAGDSGMQPDIGVTGATHTQRLHVNQSELDLLRERVAATDGLLTVRDRTLKVADRSDASDEPLKLSRLNELIRFNVLADLAHQRTEVRVHGWDVAGKSAIHETAGSDVARAAAGGGGGRLGPDVLSDIWSDAAEDLHLEMPATSDEAQALAKASMAARARRFVRGRGVTRGTPTLRVGAQVDLVDLGPWFSGVYRITAVRHTFDQAEGYRTHFEAARAALGGS
jgi:phage protein D